jgi:hypothetical protein
MGTSSLGGGGYPQTYYAAPGAASGEHSPTDAGFGKRADPDTIHKPNQKNDWPLAGTLQNDKTRIQQCDRDFDCAAETKHQKVHHQKPTKRGFFHKIGDFFKGVGNGIKHIVQSLTHLKTWLLIAGAVALCVVFPPVAAILAGIGAVMASAQIVKGGKFR